MQKEMFFLHNSRFIIYKNVFLKKNLFLRDFPDCEFDFLGLTFFLEAIDCRLHNRFFEQKSHKNKEDFYEKSNVSCFGSSYGIKLGWM